MKLLLCISLISIIISCNKEKLKSNSDYSRFIGRWESISNAEEQTVMIFKNNGEIGIESSGERGEYFKPNNYTERVSKVYNTNGIYWDDYFFYKKHPLNEIVGKSVSINPTNDTLIASKNQVNGFISDSLYTIILVKK